MLELLEEVTDILSIMLSDWLRSCAVPAAKDMLFIRTWTSSATHEA